MNKQRMVRMLEDAKEALSAVDLSSQAPEGRQLMLSEGTLNLIGHLILASAIEESGSSVSLSLDKLEKVAVELGDVATAIRQSS